MTLGYLSQPKAKGPHPGLVMLHDLSGLTTGARGMARNLATSGYAVVAPDLLSPQGGVASFRNVDAEVRKAVTATTAAAVTPQVVGALAFVKSHGGGGGRGAGLVGFGWGGTQAVLVCRRPHRCRRVRRRSLRIRSWRCRRWRRRSPPVLAILAGDDPDTSGAAERIAQVAVGGRKPHAAKVFPGVGARLPRSGRGQDVQGRRREAGVERGDRASRRAREEGADVTQSAQQPAAGGRRMARGMLVAWLAVAVSAAAWVVAGGAGRRTAGRKTVWDKVYTAEQAAQGKTTYEVSCAGCHAKDLNGRDGGGQGPELAGNAFTKKWELQTLNQLYSRDQDAHAAQPAGLAHQRGISEPRRLHPAGEQVSRRRDGADRRHGAAHVHVHRARGLEGRGGAAADHHRHAGAGGRVACSRRATTGR